ncbi:hypothetical protein [Lewinella cohaerens]|uniref:hypothetical protein n=1 Tax=Lewinella cohaerens TaxID=70995 RepID=UPI00037AAB6C|nr:hypothetical protein [Lewinella cohaerens]
MKAKVHLTAAFLLQSEGASIQIETTDQQNLVLRLSNLRAVDNIPMSKIKVFRLLRKASQAIDQKISFYLNDKRWFSCKNGRFSIHNYLFTLKAILS